MIIIMNEAQNESIYVFFEIDLDLGQNRPIRNCVGDFLENYEHSAHI